MTPPDLSDPHVLARTLVTRYLSTPETNLTGRVTEDGVSYYRVVGTGDPASPALDDVLRYRVVAFVDPRGFVRNVSAEYLVSGAGGVREVRFEATYGRFGTTEVDPPGWYVREFGANRTAGDSGERPAG
ncbi:MAG: hypothetical protein ABEJ40_07975 [Haloarculaceae archaeon]